MRAFRSVNTSFVRHASTNAHFWRASVLFSEHLHFHVWCVVYGHVVARLLSLRGSHYTCILGATFAQEVRDYSGTVTQQAKEGDAPVSMASLSEQRVRHRAYLKRKRADSWGPRKLHRVAASLWGLALEHQLQLSSDSVNLKQLKVPKEPENRSAALLWPKLNVAADLGSDGVCFMTWAKSEGVNLDLTPDTSHGVHNGTDEALNLCGLRGHMFLLMMAINTPHGPWSEDQRFVQGRQMLEEILKSDKPLECSLFQEFLSATLKDRSEEHHTGEAGLEREIWGELRDAGPFQRKGKKVNKCRCTGSQRESWRFLCTPT